MVDFFAILFIGGPIAEEFGWRGYALDKMHQKWSPFISSLILGVVWGFWHLPLFFITGTSQLSFPFYEFILMTLLLSILYSWLYTQTQGNLTVAILYHQMMNFSAATIHYWYTTSGRWISFFLTLILVLILLWKTHLFTRIDYPNQP